MKYLVSAIITVSAFTEVEAESAEEAKEKAAARCVADIHIDASFPVDECWHIDTDGTPEIKYAEYAE